VEVENFYVLYKTETCTIWWALAAAQAAREIYTNLLIL